MKYEDLNTIGRIVNAEMNLSSHYEVFHREIAQNFNLVAGYIYSQADLNKLIREKRPTFQYNLFLPIIARLLGGFKNSIIGVDFVPKQTEDTETAEIIKQVNDFILYQANDIEYELSKAFSMAIIGRIGWIKQDYIYTNEYPEGIVDIKFYDPFRIKVDLNTTRRDLKDCNYISDSGWYSIEDIVNIYAQDNEELREILFERAKILLGESSLTRYKNLIKTWLERLFETTTSYSGELKGFDVGRIKNLNEFVNRKDGLFKVIDWYEKRLTKSMILTNGINSYDITELVKIKDSNEKDWYDRDKLNLILQNPDLIGYVPQEKYEIKIFQTSIIPAFNLVLYDDPHILSNFKFVPIFCYDFHPDILETKSIVDFIKDPVRSANHRRNTMLTYITRVAHGGWIAEESVVKDYLENFLSNEIGGVKIIRDGALSQGRIKEILIPPMPTALDKLQFEDLEFIKIISGVRDNALASSESSQESGVLFRQKVLQSEIMQEWISDNSQSALLQISKNNLEYIQKMFTEERTIRIIDNTDNSVNFLKININTELGIINDVSKGQYDVIISKTPYGKAQRETEFNKIVMVFQLLASINPAYVDPILLIEASGLKNSKRIIQHIQNIINQQLQIQQNNTQNPNPNHKNINLEKLTEQLNNSNGNNIANV